MGVTMMQQTLQLQGRQLDGCPGVGHVAGQVVSSAALFASSAKPEGHALDVSEQDTLLRSPDSLIC